MKLKRCEWVPSSVAEWLSDQLEELGIPGTSYSHTLLSLLHPIFCPHPLPQGLSSENLGEESKDYLHDSYYSVSCLSSYLTEEECLFDPLEDFVHPDADFPLLTNEQRKKVKITKNKRQIKKKPKKKNRSKTSPEQAWKEAALQCLSTASDERVLLQELVEKLFFRLKLTDNLPIVDAVESECSDQSLDKSSIESGESSFDADEGASCRAITERSFNCTLPGLPIGKDNIINEDQAILISSVGFKTPVGETLENSINDQHQNESIFMQSFFDIGTNLSRRNQLPYRFEMDYGPCVSNGSQSCIEEPFSLAMQECEKEIKHSLEEWEHAGGLFPPPAKPRSKDRSRLFERNVSSAEPPNFSSQSEIVVYEGIVFENEKEDSKKSSERNDSKVDEMEGQPYCAEEDDQFTFDEYSANLEMHDSKDKQEVSEVSLPVANLLNPVSLEWNPLALNTPKHDPLFSSAFRHSPHSALKGMLGDNEEGKSCWNESLDDCSIGRMPSQVQGTEFIEEVFNFDQQHVAHSSQEHLEEPMFKENVGFVPMINKISSHNEMNMSEILKRDSWQIPNTSTLLGNISIEPASDFSDSENLCESFQQLGLEHLWKEASPKISNSFEETKSPSKPTGPYVTLQHNENSMFSTVVPPYITKESTPLEMLNSKEISVIGSGSLEELSDNNLRIEENKLKLQIEENLLTSPRTHFKPIVRDNNKVENAKRALYRTNIDNEGIHSTEYDVTFKRTGSGNLYIESDIIEGSPKKYMVYREPQQKVGTDLQALDIQTLTYPTKSPFIPKFKIVNNEKCSQTDLVDDNPSLSKSYSFSDVYDSIDENLQQNLSSKIWNNSSLSTVNTSWPDNYPQYTDSNDPPSGMLNWNHFHEKWRVEKEELAVEVNATEHCLPVQRNLFMVDDFQSLPTSLIKTTPSNEKIAGLAKVKFLWNDNGINNKISEQRNISLKDVDRNSSIFVSNEKLSTLNNDAEPFVSFENANWNRQENEISHFWGKENTDGLYCTQELSRVPAPVNAPSNWQLKQEVDQDGEELLGGLMPSSPIRSPLYQIDYNGEVDKDGEFGFLDFLDSGDGNVSQQPIEDLDNLGPGWDLCEGFEWDVSTASREPEVEEEAPGDVLVYETDDGQTLFLPIEYLEDSLYDQIFGPVGEIPIGGSLPDLPHPGGLQRPGNITHSKLSRRSRSKGASSRKPCCFFLEGNCRRSDCKYTHDLSTITCRFWEEGDCLKGDTCPFRHGQAISSRRRNRSEGDNVSFAPNSLSSSKANRKESKGKQIPKTKTREEIYRESFEIDSETDFPTLGSSVESKSEDCGLTAKVKSVKKKKKRKYITVTKSLFKEIENEHGYHFVPKSGRKFRPKNEETSTKTLFSAEDKNPPSLKKLIKKRERQQQNMTKYDYEDGTVSDY